MRKNIIGRYLMVREMQAREWKRYFKNSELFSNHYVHITLFSHTIWGRNANTNEEKDQTMH